MAKAAAKSENQYDERRETLVMETKTTFPAGIDLTEGDRARIKVHLHGRPKEAKKLEYIRTPTGFIRHITVTPEEVQSLRS